MRSLFVLLLVVLTSATYGQVTIQDLVDHIGCTDTACFGAFARSKGMCAQPVDHEKPFFYVPCNLVKAQLDDAAVPVMLTFFMNETKAMYGGGISTTDKRYAKRLIKQVQKLHWVKHDVPGKAMVTFQDPANEKVTLMYQTDPHGTLWTFLVGTK